MPRLSQEQEAVLGIESDTLLVAGAGAGKTSTLVAALEDDLLSIAPGELSVVTFTRVAASSIRSRLQEALFGKDRSVDISALWIGTIDALASRLLRQRSLESGQDPEIRPGSEAEMLRIGEMALREMDISEEVLASWIDPSRDLLALLVSLDEQCVSRGLEPRTVEAPKPDPEPLGKALLALCEVSTPKQQEAIEGDLLLLQKGELPSQGVWGIKKQTPELHLACEEREAYTRSWIDFQTMPVREELLEIFQEWRSRRGKISEAEGIWSFADILQRAEDLRVEPFLQKMYVDEAQDTSSAQFRFLRSLVRGSFVCIGDPNQSVYGFRGADLQNFIHETQSMKQIRLRDNYRSAPEIIDAVEEICEPLLGDVHMNAAGDTKRGVVQSFLLSGEGKKSPTPREEAEALVPLLWRELEELPPQEITVLLRSNHDLDVFQDIFRARGLPVAARRSRGLGWEEECRDVRALLGLLLDPFHEEYLLRVLSSPLRGLGPEELLDFSGSLGDAITLLGDPWKEALQQRNKEPLSVLARFLLQSYSYDMSLEILDPTGARRQNMEQYLDLLRSLEEEWGVVSYGDILQRLDDQAAEEGPSLEGVRAIHLQTVHGAKGEEYECVVVPRLGRKVPTFSGKKFAISSEGLLGISLPGGLRDSVAAAEEEAWISGAEGEEARLLYVALTRAKEKLFLLGSHPENKPLGGLIADLPHKSALPDFTPVAKNTQEEVELPCAQIPSEPPIRQESVSWSDLVIWNRCSLRRQLEGWGLSGVSEEGGSGRRQIGLRVHEAISAFIRGEAVSDLSPEEEEMFQRALESIPSGSQSEVPFAFALGSRVVRGRVDLLLPGARTEIIDWKTGEEEVFHEDYERQRQIYALAWLLGGSEEVFAQTIYLRSGEKESSLWKLADTEELREETGRWIEAVLQADPQPAALSPEPFCSGCPGQRLICPVASSEEKE